MGRIGVAMEKLDAAVAGFYNGLVNLIANGNRTHRLGAVGDGLGHCDDIRRDAESIGRERFAKAPEAGDYFVEDEQYAMHIANFTKALEIALGRDEATGGAGNGLDETGGDGVGTVRVDHPLEIVGEVDAAMLTLSLLELVFLEPGVAHGCDIRHRQREDVA